MKEIEIKDNDNPMVIKSFLLDSDPESVDSMSIVVNLRQGKLLGFKYMHQHGEQEHRLNHREWVQLQHLLNQLETRTAFDNECKTESSSSQFEPLVRQLPLLFRKYFNCYADTTDNAGMAGEVIQAMTEDRFIEVVSEILKRQSA